MNPSTGQIKNYKLPENLTVDISSNQFRKIFLNDKTLWIGSSTGLYSFDLDSKIFKSHTVMHNMKINDIKLISKDLIVIASMDGLFQFDLSKNLFRKNDSGMYWHALKHVDVRNLFFDKSGLLWLSTRDKGVIKVDQYGGLFQPQNNYIPENQQNEQNKQIWSLEHDSEGNLYMGTSETLFKKFKDKGFKRITIKNLNEIPGIIRDTQSSKNQGTWIGTSEGLFFLEKDSLVAQSITKPFDLLGIKPTDVFSVEETSNGEVWLALYNVGVLRWQPDLDKATLLTTYSDGLLTDINIVHIYQDSMNDIWIGSNLVGVFRFDIKTEEIQLFSHDYNNKKSLSSNRIKDIFEDSKGRLWLATFRGLNLFNPKDNTFRHFMVSDGLLDNSINAIVEDSNQILWIIYKFGISRFIPEDSLITNYLLNNDILLDGLNARSASFDKDNKLLVGGTNGFYSFDPKDIGQTKSYLPTLTLTDVRINNKTLSFDELLHNGLNFVLKPKDRVISFNFAALDFKISHQIQYKYKIHEIYDDWRDVTSNRQIELNNINPGTYLIEIKALNNDGRWAEQSLKLNLEVQPVWWNLGWVRILLVLIGVILASCINYYRTYKIKKQNELLEAKVEKRTAELVSLNKQLKKASQTDFLTGLYNRSGFIKRFKQKQKKSNEYCVVVSDIDNFKMINDIHSHSAGDTILVKVTEIMRSLMPDRDLIARWGGEEFIFYFGNKDSEQASKIIEQIRLKIENTEIRYKDKLIRVTCTFGICQRKAEMGLKDCINAADECMYQGKKKGKNMTVVSKANLSNLK